MAVHSNQLKNESSPYLLQHANNPVHWFAWGDEALAAAKAEEKPILVSIGYAACHWCHVMERESFENEAVAEIMNQHFINIKIDREERPDLDHIYMDAVQAIAGNGGWPLNVFLTPDAKPFYGGTYFPPVKAHGRNSWTDILHSIADAWANRRSEIETQAEQLIQHIKKSNNFGATKSIIPLLENENIFIKDDCLLIAENILKNADTTEGGFGKAPKFPQTFSIIYLLQHAHFFNDENALQQAELSLQKMINGGIYDQLGGGMARYSTDTTWLVPHFEKMLYDNALLLNALCEAFQQTKNNFYADAIHRTIHFVVTELKNKGGGFYAAIDADSEGLEGKFYVWQKEEIETLLGDDADLFCTHFNVTATGNWEETNILRVTQSTADTALAFGMSLSEVENKLYTCKNILLTIRNKRIRPITDDKILLGWNALMLTAFCKAFAATQHDSYKAEAVELFSFLESVFTGTTKNSLLHTYKAPNAKFPAFLDDYAWYIEACIHLQEITGDETYLVKANLLTEFVLENFADTESDFFFFTHRNQHDIVVRKIELYDGATPSANATMARNLGYLGVVFDNQDYKDRSMNMTRSLEEAIKKYPTSFGVWAACLQQFVFGTHEIAIVGQDVKQLHKAVLDYYIPNRVIQASVKVSDLPLLIGKTIETTAKIYVCKDYQCFEPANDMGSFVHILKKRND